MQRNTFTFEKCFKCSEDLSEVADGQSIIGLTTFCTAFNHSYILLAILLAISTETGKYCAVYIARGLRQQQGSCVFLFWLVVSSHREPQIFFFYKLAHERILNFYSGGIVILPNDLTQSIINCHLTIPNQLPERKNSRW